MQNFRVIDHPLAKDKLTQLRDKDTNPEKFRRLVMELASIMTYEVTRDLKTKDVDIETPIAPCKAPRLSEHVIFVPILRAGQGMVEGALKMMPFASVGHIGIYRDKSLDNTTVEYYFRMPSDVKGRRVIVLDPMLATGYTAVAALNRLKELEVGPITFCCLLSAEKGLQNIFETHPDVEVVSLSLEPELNAKDYIVPGVGDAGDRIYGTV